MDTVSASLPEGEIRLRDGRRLAYAEYGDPQGKPIFFFHGTPGSRLFHHPDNSIGTSAGARIIAVDRPGFGRSDFKTGRRLLDWPGDVVQLADTLEVERFAVMGYSGGGPYAAACAYAIPDRLTAVGLVSSLSPLDTPELTKGMHGILHTYFGLERHVPPLARISSRLMCSTWRSNPDLYFKAQINGLYRSKEAQAMLPVMKAMLTADLLEAVRGGTQGVTSDLEILAQPWGFPLHVVQTDIFLWHGEDDTQAPLGMGKRLAGAFPNCRSTFFPGEGHWAIYTHWHEILAALARAEATTREGLQRAVIGAAEGVDSGSPIEVLPTSLDADDGPIDVVQGLQPAREPAETAPTRAAEAIIADESPAGVSAEGQQGRQARKAASKKAGKRRTSADAEALAAAPLEPEPVQEAPKPVSKRTPKDRTAVLADAAAAVPAEPEPSPEASKPASKKANGRRAKAVEEPRTKDSGRVKPTPEKARAAAGKKVKGAKASTDAEVRPKASAKKASRPKAATAEPPSATVPEEVFAVPEAPEPASAKSSSRRRAAKEAVLV